MRRSSWMTFLLALVVPIALGANGTVARDRALDALRLEFHRDGVGATRADVDKAFSDACAQGYLPVCEPARWRVEDQPTLEALAPVFELPCAKGDPAACTVLGWVADAAARSAPSASASSPLYRQSARHWKTACDLQKFLPACYEYADQLFAVRGLDAEPAAGVVRWERACSAGYLRACARLAELHTVGGPGAKIDPKKAIAYAEKACTGGDVRGCAARDVLVAPADRQAALAGHCGKGLLTACREAAGTDLAKLSASDPGFQFLVRGCDLGDGAACGEAGRILEAAGDLDRALDRWALGCRHGNAGSCGSLTAATAASPTSVLRQPEAFRIACFLAESDQACTTWGTALVDGALPRDGSAARRALERACEEDSGGRACAALGTGFESGAVGERDRTLATRYYGWACAQSEFEACERRGDLLVSGVGVRRDDAVALATFTRACTGGRPTGCYKAGRVLDLGTDIARDPAQARGFYDQGCKGGVADACFGLGQLHEEGTPETGPDYAAARTAYDQAVEGGSVEARGALSRLLWQGLGGPRRKGRARELAEEACQRGDRRACQGPSFL